MKPPKGSPSLTYFNYHLQHLPETKLVIDYGQVSFIERIIHLNNTTVTVW